MANQRRGGLGKGLGALIPGREEEDTAPAQPTSPAPTPIAPEGERLIYLDPAAIRPNPKQPRKVFKEEALQELAESIRQDGMQEPVLVRQVGDDYELVSGERRVKASVMADQATVPAICRNVSDKDMLKLGLIENIQREDLNPIETAAAYGQLIEEFQWTQEELADQVGKNRATVTNTLRLLNLPADVRGALSEGLISMGHAKALLAIPDPAAQSQACQRIVKEGLSVRQAEKLAADAGAKKRVRKEGAASQKDPHLLTVEQDLRRVLGTKVNMKPSGENTGRIEIEYYNLEDLERILDTLKGRSR